MQINHLRREFRAAIGLSTERTGGKAQVANGAKRGPLKEEDQFFAK